MYTYHFKLSVLNLHKDLIVEGRMYYVFTAVVLVSFSWHC